MDSLRTRSRFVAWLYCLLYIRTFNYSYSKASGVCTDINCLDQETVQRSLCVKCKKTPHCSCYFLNYRSTKRKLTETVSALGVPKF